MEPYQSHYRLKPFSIDGIVTVPYRAVGSNKDGMTTNADRPKSAQVKDPFLHRISTVTSLLGSTNWIIGGDFNIILTLD
jgi:hypothetical protein